MTSNEEIVKIARNAATANLGSANFSSIINSTATDSTGHEALRIVIVIKPGVESQIKGDRALNTVVEIQDQLSKIGEDRFPFVEFRTETELRERGGN